MLKLFYQAAGRGLAALIGHSVGGFEIRDCTDCTAIYFHSAQQPETAACLQRISELNPVIGSHT